MPSICKGQSKCPWMNEATAQGILGGPVIVRANITNREGDCEFLRRKVSVVFHLQISVHVMGNIAKQFPAYLAQCGPKPTPLSTIGNQAVRCDNHRKGQFAERVVGRVRDQAFTVSVGSSVQNDPSMTQETRREKVTLAAEQVSGILF
jgi:hypothetical protein